MQVQIVKVLVLLTLFVLTFIFGIIPIFLKRYFVKHADTEGNKSRYKTALSLLSCYAAGVFLGTGVLDLLPDVRADLGTTLNSFHIFTSFPIAEFVMMFGLFVILIVEQIVLTIRERHAEANPETKPLFSQPPEIREKQQQQHHRHHHHHHNSATSGHRIVRSHSVSSNHSIGGISDEPFTSSLRGSTHCEDCETQDSYASIEGTNHAADTEDEFLPEHEHSSLRALMLIVALSLHSIFEGLAVGLQDKASQVMSIFAALLIHKSVLSFCLGMNLIQSRLSHAGVVKSMFFFALTSPIGIGIGIVIIDLWSSKESLLMQGILTGIACGTFLYVVFFEVLPAEFNCHEHRLLKVLFLLLGFATVTGVLFIQADSDPTCYMVPPT